MWSRALMDAGIGTLPLDADRGPTISATSPAPTRSSSLG
jgi:hypothetical protein